MAKALPLLLLAAFVAIAAAKNIRIKGARPAKITDYPSIASISDEDGDFLVHGIILSKRVIMAPQDDLNRNEITVRVGSVSWASGGEVVAVKSILQIQFVSFIVLEHDLTFGPTVKAARFSDQPSSEEYTKLQLVGWGYPTDDEEEPATDVLYVQNAPILKQEECESEFLEFFEGPEEFPAYCLAVGPNYNMFEDVVVPVYKNGVVEAFSLGRIDDSTSMIVIHAKFVYLEIIQIMNEMHSIE